MFRISRILWVVTLIVGSFAAVTGSYGDSDLIEWKCEKSCDCRISGAQDPCKEYTTTAYICAETTKDAQKNFDNKKYPCPSPELSDSHGDGKCEIQGNVSCHWYPPGPRYCRKIGLCVTDSSEVEHW